MPNDWPGISQGGKKGKNGDGLDAGILTIIVLVSLLVVGLMAYIIIQKRRAGGEDKARQNAVNAVKDHSEALGLEVDGEVLTEVVKSLKTSNTDQFDFEAVDVPMDEGGQKSPHYSDNRNGGGDGVGHGRMV